VETSHIVNDYDDDPMLQQMQIIRNYIHQARLVVYTYLS